MCSSVVPLAYQVILIQNQCFKIIEKNILEDPRINFLPCLQYTYLLNFTFQKIRLTQFKQFEFLYFTSQQITTKRI